MKRILLIMMLCMIFAVRISAADTLFVDNREKDPNDLMRLNMRERPASSSAVIGSYYTGAEVTVLTEDAVSSSNTAEGEEELSAEEQNEAASTEFLHVEIGGNTGYMARDYLIDEAEARLRHGDAMGACRAAEIDLTGMWIDHTALLSRPDASAETVATLANGDAVHLVGIVGNWAYLFKEDNDVRVYGYVPIEMVTETGEKKIIIISSGDAGKRTIFYDIPNTKAKTSMSVGNGTAAFVLFGRGEGDWRRIRIGGLSGWINPQKKSNLIELGNQPRSSIPYYPLVMETKSDALLYSVKGDKNKPYMTLGKQMQVEILAEIDDYVYARTLIGGAGAVDQGDFGYIALEDLTLSLTPAVTGVVQADDDDLPVVVMSGPDEGANVIGALCGGAQVRLSDYTQTDYVRIALDDLTGYVSKKCVRVLTKSTDPLSARIAQRALVKQDVMLLTEPHDGGPEAGKVLNGSRVYVLGKFGNWAYVNAETTPNLKVSGGSEILGFVPLSEINAPVSCTHLIAYAKEDKVNLRSRGDKTGDIIGRVRLGERLRVSDYGLQWTQVVTPEGKKGYIKTDLLTFE